MALTARSLSEISRSVRGAFRQYLPGTDASLKNNFVTVSGKVLALMVYEAELRFSAMSKQLFMATATGKFLERHCGDYGIYRKGASAARGKIVATGLPDAVYLAGVRFRSGVHIFETQETATADNAGEVVFSVVCTETGAATNRDADAIINIADPVSYPTLQSTARIDADGLGGGADKESYAGLRARGLHRKRNPPQSASLTDFERFALSVAGVTHAWAFRVSGAPGNVVVHFLFDGRANSIPLASDVAVVQAEIDSQRLVRSDDSVATAPVAQPVDIEITGLSGDTADIRSLIEAGVSAMFLERCRPGLDADPFSLPVAWISEVISGVAGEDRHTLTAPTVDVQFTGGAFPVLGTVTYA